MKSYTTHGVTRGVVLAGCFVLAVLSAQALQPDTSDEQELPPGKGGIKKRIIVDDDDPKPAPKPKPGPAGLPPDVLLEELTKAAEITPHASLKTLYYRFSIPFDLLTDARGNTVRIRTLPRYWPDEFQGVQGEFPISELTNDNRLKPVRKLDVTQVRKIAHYEALAVNELDQFLKQKPFGSEPGPDGLTPYEQLEASETILLAVLRFHDFAVERELRKARVWASLRTPLISRLQDVRLSQLKVVATSSDWARTRDVGTKLLAAYPQDPAIAKVVATAWMGRAKTLASSNRDNDKIQARELLDLIEARFPGVGGDDARTIREGIRQAAADYAKSGEQAAAANNLAAARDFAERAYALDPNAPGVPELRRKLNISPSLNVAVRYFPTRLDPISARLDSERQSVELLFESLLEEIPDPTRGTRYRVGAALHLPGIVPGGRRIAIRTIPRESNSRDGFDVQDVVGTVAILRSRSETWAAAGLPWIENLPATEGPGSLRLQLRHGHPDPRSLLTFKLLPAGWLATQHQGLSDPAYAEKPFGTGPFRIANILNPGLNRPRELVLVPNKSYDMAGTGRKGQPYLTEIRLIESIPGFDPTTEFQAGRLHLLPDPTPAELDRIVKPDSALMNKVKVVTSGSNRRVYLLAVNHRKPALRSRDLRVGLSEAIHRETILAELDKSFPVMKKYRRHTAPMVGPFPPKSWATPRGLAALSNPDAAHVKLRRYLDNPGSAAELTLIYPTAGSHDDPRPGEACRLIKEQVEALFRTDGNRRKLTIRLDPLPLPQLLIRVMDEHSYDLAYLPFDYPDDWYPYGLAAMLDPSAGGRGGRNCVGFRVPGTNPDGDEIQLGQWLSELRDTSDFAGSIVPRTAEIHEKFNLVMPFIPLWQLDRQLVISDRLKVHVEDLPKPSDPSVINPTILFYNVARWRLE